VDESYEMQRRQMLAGLVAGGCAIAGTSVPERAGAGVQFNSASAIHGGQLDAKADFSAQGDGVADDTEPLQRAIDAGSGLQRVVGLPAGVYRITRPLKCPPNTMLMGSAPGLGFGCLIEPIGCAAFTVGGKEPSFHCAIQNLMIWPKGTPPACIISIDNSYSVTFRNIRIHESQDKLKRAAVLLLGETSAGGHGPCANIIWDNLIVRNDSGQPGVAVLATKGCGSHRFYSPDLENYAVLFEWQGGQIDLITPYTERAGRYAVNCNTDVDDPGVYLNTFGGMIDSARSGIGCAIRASTRNFNSFGTVWGATTDMAAYAYSLPNHPVNFHGISPNCGNTGKARFSGVAGWRKAVKFPQQIFSGSQSVQVEMPPGGTSVAELTIPGVVPREFWAKVAFNSDSRGSQLNAFVSAPDTVTIVAQNIADRPIKLSGILSVECGIV
jgi:hypothetical protein